MFRMITTTDGKIFLIILFKFDEIEQIKEEQAEKQQNEISKQEQLSKFNSRDVNQ